MRLIHTILILLFAGLAMSQNTVGLLSYDPMNSYDGYNLIYPHNQPSVYLIDNCGQVVHSWQDSSQYRPGNTAYLLANGDLVKTKRRFDNSGNPLHAGGGGATVEVRDWDNNLKSSYTLNDTSYRLHHDIAITGTGNVLMIAWENKTLAEAVEAGRDTAQLERDELWPDYILEWNPSTDAIVWEWHAWDHLIQEHDTSKSNFGIVANHPELIDINYPADRLHPDWMHANALDYEPTMDLIAISIPYFNEVWFIDHSTSTAEAASHIGGDFGVGGDLIYRWGNPAAYQAGDTSDQKLFFQHDVHWIDDYLPNTHPLKGKFAMFNNRVGADFSSANVINAELDYAGMTFPMFEGKWLPLDFDETYLHPIPTMMYSAGLSSVQHLPNGNVLLCAGRLGYSFELTPSNEIVWEYKTPLLSGNPVAQGTNLSPGNNNTFRMTRIPTDYQAFDGRDLTPGDYIELDPNLNFCDSLTATMGPRVDYKLNVYPNPASNELTIEWSGPEKVEIAVYNVLGQPQTSFETYGGRTFVNTTEWLPGFHFIMIDGQATKVVLIE